MKKSYLSSILKGINYIVCLVNQYQICYVSDWSNIAWHHIFNHRLFIGTIKKMGHVCLIIAQFVVSVVMHQLILEKKIDLDLEDAKNE